jgi:8-oxo-dGTP pyrophosphatase MutT (NUDIX family)
MYTYTFLIMETMDSIEKFLEEDYIISSPEKNQTISSDDEKKVSNIDKCKKLINENGRLATNNISVVSKDIDHIVKSLEFSIDITNQRSVLLEECGVDPNEISTDLQLYKIQENINLIKGTLHYYNEQIIENNKKLLATINNISNNHKKNNRNHKNKKFQNKITKSDDEYIGVSIVIAVYGLSNKLYIGCHFDNNPKQFRYRRISGCGGHVDEGENYVDAAIREAQEEHGLVINDKNKLEFISKNYNEKTNKCYKYFGFDVKPTDYLTENILTPDEVFKDEKYINKVFSTFPENSVINTGANSTYLIDLDVLTSDIYGKHLYQPFYHFLKKLKENK